MVQTLWLSVCVEGIGVPGAISDCRHGRSCMLMRLVLTAASNCLPSALPHSVLLPPASSQPMAPASPRGCSTRFSRPMTPLTTPTGEPVSRLNECNSNPSNSCNSIEALVFGTRYSAGCDFKLAQFLVCFLSRDCLGLRESASGDGCDVPLGQRQSIWTSALQRWTL